MPCIAWEGQDAIDFWGNGSSIFQLCATNLKDRQVLHKGSETNGSRPIQPGGSSHWLAALPPCAKTSKIVKFFTKDPRPTGAGQFSRAVARIGWRPCSPVRLGSVGQQRGAFAAIVVEGCSFLILLNLCRFNYAGRCVSQKRLEDGGVGCHLGGGLAPSRGGRRAVKCDLPLGGLARGVPGI